MMQYILPVVTINFLQYLYFSKRVDTTFNKIHSKLDTLEYKLNILEKRITNIYK